MLQLTVPKTKLVPSTKGFQYLLLRTTTDLNRVELLACLSGSPQAVQEITDALIRV